MLGRAWLSTNRFQEGLSQEVPLFVPQPTTVHGSRFTPRTQEKLQSRPRPNWCIPASPRPTPDKQAVPETILAAKPLQDLQRQARKAHAGSVKQICPCEICLCPLMFLVGGGRRRRIALHGREMFLIEVIPSRPASMVL
jgi:hypothetical protein